ncbi:MAG: glycosyltransferase family A protein [bacterium]
MSRPFFSIVMAAFNRARLLPRAVESVLQQDFTDWELLVIDDGSTDSTSAVVESLQKLTPRLLYFQRPHRGLAPTRNFGFEKSSGLYLTSLDSDDEYLPGHLSLHHAFLQAHPEIEMLRSRPQIVGDPYVPDFDRPGERIHLDECVVGCTFMVKAEVMKRMGGYPDLPFGDDTQFWRKGKELGIVQAVSRHRTYRYHRDEPDSICNQKMNSPPSSL